jgi:hypothetical protein
MSDTCIAKPESVVEKLHWMIHEASYEISQGNLEAAKKILADADQLSHDHC